MLAHLPQQRFSVGPKDVVEPYVIFTNSHDQGVSARCYPTSVRVVCANTFRVSGKEGKGRGISIRHNGNVKAKVKAAQQSLGLAVREFGQFADASQQMAKTPCDIKHYANDVLDAVLDVTEAEAKKGADLLAAVLETTEANRELAAKSIEKKIERRGEILADILERYESKECQNGRGTMWAGFNAVTSYADHNKIGKQYQDGDGRRSRHFESVLVGDMDTVKQVAFDKATASR